MNKHPLKCLMLRGRVAGNTPAGPNIEEGRNKVHGGGLEAPDMSWGGASTCQQESGGECEATYCRDSTSFPVHFSIEQLARLAPSSSKCSTERDELKRQFGTRANQHS